MGKCKVLITSFESGFESDNPINTGKFGLFNEKDFDSYDDACAFISEILFEVINDYSVYSTYTNLLRRYAAFGDLEVILEHHKLDGHYVYINFSKEIGEGQICEVDKERKHFATVYKIIEM